ncbi:non-heme iron oxygenase ferredoxin subunit [SAR202 cluster bacterium AC-647-N09_OGT_505m]|nr:non-heme iron oxygenase ferredoxin subunit [SAR202 cluster bacterium AC-647-N09_OGT_505m]
MLVEVEDERILLANVGGQYYAVTDLCTHAECPLSDGDLDGEVLKCPCHGSQFDVRTGEVVAPPADEPLTLYAVRVEGDDILVGPGG